MGRSESGGDADGLPPSLTHSALGSSSWYFRTRPTSPGPHICRPHPAPTHPSVTPPGLPLPRTGVVVMATAAWGGGSDFASPAPPSAPLSQISLFPWQQILQISVPTWSRPREGPPVPPPRWPRRQSFPPPTAGSVSATPPAPGSPAPLWGPANTCVKQPRLRVPSLHPPEGPRSPGPQLLP